MKRQEEWEKSAKKILKIVKKVGWGDTQIFINSCITNSENLNGIICLNGNIINSKNLTNCTVYLNEKDRNFIEVKQIKEE